MMFEFNNKCHLIVLPFLKNICFGVFVILFILMDLNNFSSFSFQPENNKQDDIIVINCTK